LAIIAGMTTDVTGLSRATARLTASPVRLLRAATDR
jgi:hypothetical protein